ncbi:Serpin domain-containing protein [Scenedesmus sp. NREL 46B-D3]|nr:Serpin domain-containing protein [Scenedesmus sp. NREL 46B-D3]
MSVPAAAVFGLNLFGALAKLGAGTAGGLFISPLSAYIALILALNGAGPLSSTQRELWAVLTARQLPNTLAAANTAEAGLNSEAANLMKNLMAQSGNGTQLTIASAVWTNKTSVLKPYSDSMLKLLQAPVTAVTSVAPINEWSSKVTRGLIKTAVPANSKFKAVITNSVYFKGAWQYQFSPSSTYERAFTTPANKQVQVDMMNKGFYQGDVKWAELPGQFRAVKLPYKGSKVVAVAVLPDKAAYKLDAAAALAGIGLNRILNAPWRPASAAEPRLQVALPKFKISQDMLPVGQALRALNVTAAFNPKQADLSRLSAESLYITDVMQSVVVIVDEVGTEAAAVTSIMVGATAFIQETTPPIVFDRPFIFMLVDDVSSNVLFMGVVKDPTKMSVK